MSTSAEASGWAVASGPGGEAAPRGPIVYLAPKLPSRSQTFVYHEILALRAEGADLIPVTVRHNPFMAAVEGQLGSVYAILGPTLLRDLVMGVAIAPRRLGAVTRELAGGPFLRRSQALRTAFHILLGVALAPRLRRWRATYVHAHHAEISTTVAMVAARVAGVPFGFTAHGSDVHTHPLLLRQKLEAADVVVAANGFVRGLLAKISPTIPVRVVRCPVPLDRFRTSAPRGHSDTLRLLHVGRLDDVKDQRTLIEAVGMVVTQGLDLELRIVGDGPRRNDLERLIDERHLNAQIELLGAVRNDSLPQLYAWADAFAMSSRREGLPIVLVEALASGLPVAATDVGGTSELVRDGVEGFLVPPVDPAALAGAIARLSDRELRAQMGPRGVERAKMHDLAHVARTLLDLFPTPKPEATDPVVAVSGIEPGGGTAPPIGAPLPVCVVLRAERGGELLLRALQSVADQRPRLPVEVLVTGPDTPTVRAAVAAAGLRFLPSGDGNRASDLGDAVAACDAPWIAPLDERDAWLPQHLAVLWEHRRNRVAVAGTTLGPGDAVSPGLLSIAASRFGFAGHAEDDRPLLSAVLMRREIFIGSAGTRVRGDDADIWRRVCAAGPVGFCAAPVSTTTSACLEQPGRRGDRRASVPRSSRRHLLVGRRRARMAADGGPSVAILPSAAPMREEAERLMAERDMTDLTAVARPFLRLVRRPTSMAFVGCVSDALIVRALGIRPLWPDRGEEQTRSSRTRAAVDVVPVGPLR